MHRSRGFTLVELLIVLAIIVLLIGLLLPVGSAVRRSTQTAQCLNNMRNLQMAHLLYANDHDGRFIDVGLGHGGEHVEEEIAWINTLQGYYRADLLLKSPADRSPHWPLDMGGDGVPIPGTTDVFRRTSYGVNSYLTREAAEDPDRPVDHMHMIKSPQHQVHFVIMAETGEFAAADHPDVAEWWTGNSNDPPIIAAEHVATGMHGGKPESWDARTNYGFLDGHAETLRFADVFVNPELNRFHPAVSHLFSIRRGMRE